MPSSGGSDACVGAIKTETIDIDIFEKNPDISDEEALKALYRANWLSNRRITFTYTYDGFNIDKWPIYLAYWKNATNSQKVRTP